MASSLVKAIVFIGSLILGIGITMFYDSIMPGTDLNILILMAIGMTLASFVSLYFMTKGSGG